MSSLHDRYFSEINRNYMFNLCRKVINDRYNIDLSEDKYFLELFTKNMKDIFEKTNTDELSVINRNLLNAQIDGYKHYNKDKNNCMILNAVNRKIEENNSIYNFNISTYEGNYCIKYIVLSKDKNILFSNPFIIVSINNNDIHLKLKSSYNLQNREFLEYIPIHTRKLSLSKLTNVIIKSSLNIIPKTNNLTVTKVHKDHIEVKNNDYLEGDLIKIDNNIIYIKDSPNNKDVFFDNIQDYEIVEGKNILNISESPVIVFDEVTN